MGTRQDGDTLEVLRPLLEPNPSGAAKLVAAWDCLLGETQIRILGQLDSVRFPAYLVEGIRVKALDSGSPYIRYLAARALFFSKDDPEDRKQLQRRIEQDPDPLVRFSLLESSSTLFDSQFEGATFFALPHAARLAKVRALSRGGEAIAKLIHHALAYELPEGRVSELELFEILSSYVARESFKAYYRRDDDNVSYDGYGEYLNGKDIDALWRLVPDLPQPISHVLIENLPPGAGLASGIPAEVLDRLTEHQLECLFFRPDLDLPKLRKKFYLDDSREGVRSAAISSHFDLSPEEFGRVLSQPKDQRESSLRNLASMGRHLSLPVLAALHDSLSTSESGFEYAAFPRNRLRRRIPELNGWVREHQIRELRLYQLARSAVPWKVGETGYGPYAPLEFLADCVVPGDTWTTYSRMSSKWYNQHNRKKLERHLPRLYELNEDDTDLDEGEVDGPALQTRLESHLSKIVGALTTQSGSDRASLPELVTRLAADFSSSQSAVSAALQTLQPQLQDLKKASDRQAAIGYFALALLAIFLLHHL